MQLWFCFDADDCFHLSFYDAAMMKRNIFIAFVLLCLVGASIMLLIYHDRNRESYNFIQGLAYGLNISPNDTLIVSFFHPECDICHSMFPQYKEHQTKCSIILICYESDSVIQQTATTYEWNHYPNIHLVSDSTFHCSNHLLVNSCPSTFTIVPKSEQVKRKIEYTNFKKILP